MSQISKKTKLFPIMIYQKIDEAEFQKYMTGDESWIETERRISDRNVSLFNTAIEQKEIVIAIIISKKDADNENRMGFSVVEKVENEAIHFSTYNKEYSKSLEQFVFVNTGNTLKFVMEKGRITPFGYVCKAENIEEALEIMSRE